MLGDGEALDQEIVELLFGVMALLKRHVGACVSDLRLTPQQAQALRCLDPDRPLPMRDLAADLHCDASTVTGLADRLEQLGLVERRPDRTDRRVKALVLTPAGIGERDRIVRRLLERSPVVAALDVDDRKQLHDLLVKIVSQGR